MPVPFWAFYFNVDGIAAAVERLKAGGGTVVNGPMQVPGGQWIVQAIDPQGAHFSLVSYNA
jgi:predicted enzyme related to lactoylglutathione lyase